jgi:alpha,alpha-trehalose phosphorylase
MLVIRDNRLKEEELLIDESIFTLQNGLIGVRGNFAEGYGVNHIKETLVNGFLNFYNYIYEENSPKFPQIGQRIINVIDGQTVEFYLDGKQLNLKTAELINLKRELDLSTGLYKRESLYKTKDHLNVLITERRLVLFEIRELFVLEISIKILNGNANVRVVSKLSLPQPMKNERLDSRIHKPSEAQLLLNDIIIDNNYAMIKASTTKSRMSIVTGCFHNQNLKIETSKNGIEASEEFFLEKNDEFSLEKFVIYTPSTIHDETVKSNQEIYQKIKNKNFDYFLNLQKKHLDNFWDKTHLNIYGNEEMDRRVKYNLFQLYSSALDSDLVSIPAKGLTGEGYEGHYFWDTEIYMVPFFTINHPEIAKKLLLYRYNKLKEAKEEALNQGIDKGIKFPWRTINGYEASPYFLAGSAQYHINADIAYAYIKYYQLTKDLDFMINYGFEILLETSRFLYAAGNYNQGKFHINNVTGPDEYTTLVNDNYFTNSMTKYQFSFLVDFYQKNKVNLKTQIEKFDVLEKEILEYQLASETMNIIFDEKLGIYAQDSSFLTKAELDLNSVPKDTFPLLLHYHPLFIYRHQVLKQADVLLSMILLDSDNLEILRNNFDYYLKRTTHDSSLSKCIHAIVALRLGLVDLGTKFLEDTIAMDFENLNNNTDHGLHIANSGGIYLAILLGIFGFKIDNEQIFFFPILPKGMKGIETKINYQGIDITVSLDSKVNIKVSKPILIGIYTDKILIKDNYQCDYKSF